MFACHVHISCSFAYNICLHIMFTRISCLFTYHVFISCLFVYHARLYIMFARILWFHILSLYHAFILCLYIMLFAYHVFISCSFAYHAFILCLFIYHACLSCSFAFQGFIISLGFWYIDTHTVRLTSASVTMTSASQIRKEFSVEQKSLHHCCTRNAFEVLQHKSFVSLLSWSSAFDFYKYDSKRAIFDVGYQVWNESFLKLFQKLRFWCSSAIGH